MSFLKDLPCRNPESFTRFHCPGAIRQTVRSFIKESASFELIRTIYFQSVRPTYSAKLDSNVKGRNDTCNTEQVMLT
jgi:hypothetical protein